MPVSHEFTKIWFDNLSRIQREMRNLNHLTETGLKRFSKQKQGDLLVSELIKGNLSQFCFQELGLMVPDAAFVATRNFRTFLNRISFSIEETLVTLFYRVAVKFRPALLNNLPSEVAAMTIEEVYGSGPISLNQAKQELHGLLITNTPRDFYPASGELLEHPETKLRDVIQQLLD
jgi:hypothetical protein